MFIGINSWPKPCDYQGITTNRGSLNMKKLIIIATVAFTIAAGAYILSQSVNAKSVTANACQGSDYCQ